MTALMNALSTSPALDRLVAAHENRWDHDLGDLLLVTHLSLSGISQDDMFDSIQRCAVESEERL